MDALATHLYAGVLNHREIQTRIKHRLHLSNQLSPIAAVPCKQSLVAPTMPKNLYELLAP